MDSVYVYIRFSTTAQEVGDSKERQINACLGLVERNGWALAEPVFGDLGMSAWRGNHLKSGELGKFASRVRSGEIPTGSILLVEALDRLSRQEWREARDWLEDMTDLGLRIATVEGDRIYDRDRLRSRTGMFEVMEVMMRTMAANEYSERLSIRLKSSWAKRRKDASEGRIISRHVPGWLEVVGDGPDRVFKPVPERVTTVAEIYRLAAEGVGARSIARTLNERGVQPWGLAYHHARSSSPGWEHTYIADILKAPAVEGDYEPKVGRHRAAVKTGERFVGYFGPAIIDADLIARARASVLTRRGKGGRGRDQCRNLFSGLAKCGQCGGVMVMVGNSARPARYLQCVDAKGGRGCKQTKTFPYGAFEAAALRTILPLALDDRFFTRPDNTHALAVQVAETAKAVDLKQAHEDRLVELLLKIDSDAVVRRLQIAGEERKALERQHAELESALTKARGTVSPAEHMNRVLEVRHALTDEDYETRLAARRKVSEAIKAIGLTAACFVNPDGTKATFMSLMMGTVAFGFDDKGNDLGGLDLIDPDRVDETAEVLAISPEAATEVASLLEGLYGDEPAWQAFKRRKVRQDQPA